MSAEGRRAYDAPPQVETLREMRLWHWKQARGASHVMDSRANRFERENARDNWNLHMRFVQLLNDFFPMGDTAERDAANEVVKASVQAVHAGAMRKRWHNAPTALDIMDAEIQDDIDSWRGG